MTGNRQTCAQLFMHRERKREEIQVMSPGLTVGFDRGPELLAQ